MTGAAKHRPTQRTGKRGGFALLAVIWGTGIISLLVVSFMTTGRLRLQTAHNIASAAQAGYIAQGVVNLATLKLLAERDVSATRPESAAVYDGAPTYCVFDGAAIALAVEEESGKVDLNAATPELLQMTLVGLGLDARAAEAASKSIIEFRATPSVGQIETAAPSDKPFGPKRAPFETVMELDQVSGVEPSLFRALVPFVTVHSRSPGVNPFTSPPGLFAALAGFVIEDVQALSAAPYPNKLKRNDPRFPGNLIQPGDRGAYLIHVEALLATGQTTARDAILDLRESNGKAFAIKELRRGQSKYVDQLRLLIATNGAGVPDC